MSHTSSTCELRKFFDAAQIRAEGGGASQFSQTQGNPHIAVSLLDAGLYAEDDWKLKPNITLSYGLRFETQTDIHDHADFGPRAAFSWAIPASQKAGKNKPPRAVLRSGAGFFPQTCSSSPNPCANASNPSVNSPTIYEITPNIRSPYIFIAGIGVDKHLGKSISPSANR